MTAGTKFIFVTGGVVSGLGKGITAAALGRMDRRREGEPALGAVSRFLDAAFPDHFLHARYPNMGILSEIGWYD